MQRASSIALLLLCLLLACAVAGVHADSNVLTWMKEGAQRDGITLFWDAKQYREVVTSGPQMAQRRGGPRVWVMLWVVENCKESYAFWESYRSAARRLHQLAGSAVSLGVFDCYEDQDLCKSNGLEETPTVTAVIAGQREAATYKPPEDYKNPRSLVNWVMSIIPVQHTSLATEADARVFFGANPQRSKLVIFLPKDEKKDGKLPSRYSSLAADFADRIDVAVVYERSKGSKYKQLIRALWGTANLGFPATVLYESLANADEPLPSADSARSTVMRSDSDARQWLARGIESLKQRRLKRLYKEQKRKEKDARRAKEEEEVAKKKEEL